MATRPRNATGARSPADGGRPPVIGITGGDPNGIGPEVVLRALLAPAAWKACRPLLVGDPVVFRHYARRFRLPISIVEVDRPPLSWGQGVVPVVAPGRGRPVTIEPGRPSRAAGALAGRSLGLAVELWKDGEVDGIVTGPLSKATLNAAGYAYPGQTEFLAEASGAERALMLMLSGPLRVGLATIHIPLRRVAAAVTRERVAEALRVFGRSLVLDFGIRLPSIAVLGLNPHAGEGGLLGVEEREVILPAMRRVRVPGLSVGGPFPADGFFAGPSRSSWDGVLAMYHDQGLIPLKMGGFSAVVNFTAGLPLVRTSPGHGTAYDIAGRGVADPGSALQAILAAAAIVRRRAAAGRGAR